MFGEIEQAAVAIIAGSSDRAVLQAALRWKPNDQWTFDASWSHMNQNENNRGGSCRYVQSTGFIRLFERLSGESFEAACRQSEAAGKYNFYADTNQFLRTRVDSVTGEAAWEAPGSVGIFDSLGATFTIGVAKHGDA